MLVCGIPISHGHYTRLTLRAGFSWSLALGIESFVFHVLSSDMNLELSDTLNSEWKAKVEEIRKLFDLKAIEKVHKAISDCGGDRKQIKNSAVLHGKVIDAILEETKNKHFSFLVLGPKTRNDWGELFLGSNTERLLKMSSVPVLVTKTESAVHPKNVFWATDLSDLADETIKWIIKLKNAFQIKLTLCHVKRTGHNYQEKLDQIEQIIIDQKCSHQIRILEDNKKNVGETLISEINAGDFDLVVFGAKRNRNVLDLFLGSVEEYLIHNIKQSFFLINVPR